jgi:hypothetical protein
MSRFAMVLVASLTAGLGCRAPSSEPTVEAEIDVSQATSLLDESLERGVPVPSLLARLSAAAVQVDPHFGVAWTRRAASLLATAEHRCDMTEALLAMHVAPHDLTLRNDLLGTAMASGRACLADERNWVERESPPGTVFLGSSRARERDLLDLLVSLWEILAEENVDDVTSIRELMRRAESSGALDGDAPQRMIDILRRELAGLDPELLIAAWPEGETDALAWFLLRGRKGTASPRFPTPSRNGCSCSWPARGSEKLTSSRCYSAMTRSRDCRRSEDGFARLHHRAFASMIPTSARARRGRP